MISIKTVSESETQDVGIILGSILKKGDIVALEGELGVGKTVFVKGIAAALGVAEYVTSPTFVIMNEYKGRFPLYHFDVYRISDPQDMYDIGFDEYICSDGIVIIEWADLTREILPAEIIWIKMERTCCKKDETGKRSYKRLNGLIEEERIEKEREKEERAEEERILHIDFIGKKYREQEEYFISGMGKKLMRKEVDKD